MQPFLEAKRDQIAELCRTHHVRRLSIFGSAVRDDFDPLSSDVDLRVEFDEEGAYAYAENYFNFCERITELLGRRVDVISSPVISNRFFREAIEESQVTMYAA